MDAGERGSVRRSPATRVPAGVMTGSVTWARAPAPVIGSWLSFWAPSRRRLAVKPACRSAGRLVSRLPIPKSRVSLMVVWEPGGHMPDSSPRIRAMPRVLPEVRRAAAVTALLALAAIGLRAPGGWPAMGHAAAFTVAGRAFTAVFGAAEGAALAACALLTAAIFRTARRRRKPDDDFYVQVDPPVPWSARAFALLLALAVLGVPFVLLGLQPRHRHPPGRSAVTAPPPVSGHAAGSQQAAAGTFTWALAAALAATALAAIAFARPRALDGGRARAASRVPRCQWAGGAGALASVGGVTALRVLDRMSMLDRVAVRARLAENLLEQVTDAIVGQLVADDPAVPAAGHGAARPEQPQRLGHGGVVQPGGDRQVRDADRAGPVDAQQQREPGRVGQDLESLRPGPDVLAVPDRADGRADELAVEDAAAEIRRYEMHALIMPAGGNYSLPSA